MTIKPATRCVLCAHEFVEAEIQGAIRCPNCGTQAMPVDISEDVSIKINWHELRILCNWATWHADTVDDHANLDGCLKVFPADLDGCRKIAAAIIARLEGQKPQGFAPLTLAGEIQDASDVLGVTISTVTPAGAREFVPKVGKA